MELFDCAPFFMTRTALLPQCVELDDSDTANTPQRMVDFYHSTPLFREAIAIASPSLHEAMKKLDAKSPHEIQKIFPSLLKYFLRMQSRLTPFGLFSSVGVGVFDPSQQLGLTPEAVKKKVRPDMEWMQSIIHFCQGCYDLVKKLHVMTNPLVITQAGRISLSELTQTQSELISIRNTALSKKIMELAKKPICYEALEEQLIEIFNQYESQKVVDYLWQFFTKKFLISELSIEIHRAFSLERFIAQIKHTGAMPEELSFLENVKVLIDRYEEAKGIESISLLEELFIQMNAWKKVDYPLLVDSFMSGAPIQLPRNIAASLEEIATVIMFLSSSSPPHSLQTFTNQFLEKYGTTRLVPLFELLDPNMGLGLPKEIKQESSLRPDFLKALLCLNSSEKELVLDSLIESLNFSEKEAKAIPPSLELYFEVTAAFPEAMENDSYTIIINSLSATNQAGCTFGRFLYLLSDTERKGMKKLLTKEEALLPEVLFVETSFTPEAARTANVCFYEKSRPYHLLLHYHKPQENSLNLEDIYVGATQDRLFLYSKQLKKEIYVTPTSAVNLDLAPPYLKFLIDISRYRFKQFSPFLWEQDSTAPYLPRVRYKNVILSLARWYFDQKLLKINKSFSHEQAAKALRDALHSFKVPHKVYLTQFDHRLGLDWSKEEHFNLMLHHLLQKETLLLFEEYKDEKVISSPQGKHATEFVVPLVKKELYQSRSEIDYFPSTEPIEFSNRTVLPGGEWMYVKLFVPSENEEVFLTQHIAHFIASLIEEKLISQWFYVRYHETSPHLRLRLKPSQIEYNTAILTALHDWSEPLCADGMLSHLSLHPYEKEVERYGGLDCMETVEAFFCADSTCCVQLLQIVDEIQPIIPFYAIGALGVMHILRHFFHTPERMADFLTNTEEHANLLSGFRSFSAKLTEWSNAILFETEGVEDKLLSYIKACFHSTNDSFDHLKHVLETNKNKNIHQEIYLIESLIHMRCNRLLGINPELERKARVIAYATSKKIPHLNSRKQGGELYV